VSHSSKQNSKRRRIRCTFQAQGNTKTAEFLDFLCSSVREKPPRELMQEAAEVYWMPVHLLYQYRGGEITSEQFRERVLLAISQQEAWLNYCCRLTETDLTLYKGYSGATVVTATSSSSTRSNFTEDPPVESEIRGDSAPLADAPDVPSVNPQFRSMKPLFGGAYLQEEEDC
jgi:hypothetical protein